MIFTDLPAAASVFLDANVIVYHFSRHTRYGTACTNLLERIARQDLSGCTSSHVLSEAAHRLMTLEAVDRYGWSYAGIAPRLRKHPAKIQALTQFRQAIDEVPRFGIQVLAIPPALIQIATERSQQYGLLHNDALIVAVMQANGLTNLASEDDDFDRVPGLTRYAPV
jgi:predicted nucleic acid-binding protein